MNLKNFLRGVEILRPHYTNPDGYHLQGEHDEVFLFAPEKPLSEEQVAELKRLGWVQPNATVPDVYDPEASWCAFT